MADLFPAFYVPHGGGPCFFMEWDPPETWRGMENWFRGLSRSLPEKPSAILLVSAHWEAEAFTVTSGEAPELIYDYYGFPEETYRLTYPAKGNPALAHRVAQALAGAGVQAAEDPTRGFDHGVFIPLKLIFPEADIPVVALSLRKGLDPADHLRAGQALAELRREKVMILGSGMSYHNLRGLMQGGAEVGPASLAFDGWLDQTLGQTSFESRAEGLRNWKDAPAARASHPREEHLIPLMVVAGAGGEDPARKIYAERVMGAFLSAWQFG